MTLIMASMEEIRPEVLDFMYEHVRDVPERQIGDARARDSKMVWIFSAATVVIGLAGLSSGAATAWGDTAAALLIIALAAYVVNAAFAVAVLWPRKFWRSLHPDVLLRNYWQDSPHDTKHAVIADIATSYAHNRDLLERKAGLIRWAVIATALEANLVGAALIVSRWG